MAHGSKKWIRRYDGKLKRSNNRTKNDYYGELQWWDDMPLRTSRWRFGSDMKAMKFCPQCKHVRKHIVAETAAQDAINDQIRREYITKYGNITEENRRKPTQWWNETDERYIERTGFDPKVVYFDVFRYNHPDYAYVRGWMHHWCSYLCFKCEQKAEVKDMMRNMNVHGKKANYQYAIRHNYQKYRSEVRTLMNKAKYDDRYYEQIPSYKHEWYD